MSDVVGVGVGVEVGGLVQGGSQEEPWHSDCRIVLHLFCVGCGVLLGFLSTFSPLWCKSPTVSWKCPVLAVQRAYGLVKVDPAEKAYCGTAVGLESVCV